MVWGEASNFDKSLRFPNMPTAFFIITRPDRNLTEAEGGRPELLPSPLPPAFPALCVLPGAWLIRSRPDLCKGPGPGSSSSPELLYTWFSGDHALLGDL